MQELYSISDLKLLLSTKESFGLVALEAMACGVPCIGTNVGGIPEVIKDGYTGFICELGNIDEYFEKAMQILTNSALHKRFSDHSIEMVKQKFNADKAVSYYEEIYFRLLNTGENDDTQI